MVESGRDPGETDLGEDPGVDDLEVGVLGVLGVDPEGSGSSPNVITIEATESLRIRVPWNESGPAGRVSMGDFLVREGF